MFRLWGHRPAKPWDREHHWHRPVRMRILLVNQAGNFIYERYKMGKAVALPDGAPIQAVATFYDANSAVTPPPTFTTPLEWSVDNDAVLPSLSISADGFTATGTAAAAGIVNITAEGTDSTGKAWSDTTQVTLQAGQAVTMQVVVTAAPAPVPAAS